MVDPGHLQLDLRIWHAQDLGQRVAHAAHLVAQPDRTDAGGAGDATANRGHGVTQVEQPGLRAALLHLASHLRGEGDVAQAADQPAWPDRVADRLSDAVALWDS